MNIATSRRNMAALTSWAIGVRVFAANCLDGAALMNSGWISVAISIIMTLPIALCIASITKSDTSSSPMALLDGALTPWARRMLCGLLFLCSVYEVSVSSRFITLSAEYAALDTQSTFFLTCVSLAVYFVASLGGGTGISGGVMLWRPVFYCIIAILVIIVFKSLNPYWLAPVLGPGIGQLARSAVAFSGMQTAILTGWLCMGEESGQSQSGGANYKQTGPYLMLQTMIRYAISTLVLILSISMLTPHMPNAPTNRSFYLEQFLANDRYSTTLQFPLTVIWFINWAFSLSFHMYAAASMLCAIIPRLKYHWCLAVTVIAGLAMTVTQPASREYIDSVNSVRYVAVTAFFLLFVAGHHIKQRRAAHAKA